MNVLFVGNSYTFFNEIPSQVRALAAEVDRAVEVAQSVEGGAHLQTQIDALGVLERIRGGGFTHVVIQDMSTSPLHDYARFMRAGAEIASVARGEGAAVVLYETWARRAGHEVYRAKWSGGSPAAMTERVTQAYRALAAWVDASVAPVGRAWWRALEQGFPERLHDEDDHHASPNGSHLAALVLAATLVDDVDPRTARYHPPDVSDDAATLLRTYAADAIEASAAHD